MVVRPGSLLLIIALVGCKSPPTSSGTAEPAAVAPGVAETEIRVSLEGAAEDAPTLTFGWPREGRIGVEVATRRLWTEGDAGEESTEESNAWIWTLAGATTGPLRLASSDGRSLSVRADGALQGGVTDADADLWRLLVGSWSGRSAAVGTTFQTDGALGVPGFEGVSAPAAFRHAVVGRVPCRERARDLRCLELEVRGAPSGDIEALRRELQASMGVERSVRDVDVREHARLRTVGSTLQPHALEVERITRVRFRGADGTEAVRRVQEIRSYRFDWAR